MKDGWDGISSESDWHVLDVEWIGDRKLTVDINPIHL